MPTTKMVLGTPPGARRIQSSHPAKPLIFHRCKNQVTYATICCNHTSPIFAWSNGFPQITARLLQGAVLLSKMELLNDLEQETDSFIAQTQKRICQLIDLELQSCCLSTQFGYLAQQIGSLDRAVREAGEAEKRCQNILR